MFDTLAPAVPSTQSQSLDLSMMDGARLSYKCAAWHVGQLGVVIRKDLPGDDDPASVKEVEGSNRAWVHAAS